MRATSWLLLLPVCLACAGDSGPRAAAPVIRQENGVTIVENAGLHVADSMAWSIDTTNVTRIGMVEGPEEYLIGRLAGMMRMQDGSILIADAIAHELRVFDRSGRFVRRTGRKGEGPGEYGWLSYIMPYTGTDIAVIDNESSRVNVLDADLGFRERYPTKLVETRARYPMTSHRLVGLFSDGSALMSDYINPCGPSDVNGFCEDSVAFFRTDREGNTLARFGTYVYSRSQSRQFRRGSAVTFGEPHPQAMWEVRGERFYYADAKRFEVLSFTMDGKHERRIRVHHTAPAWTRDEALPPSPATPNPDPRMEEVQRAMLQLHAEAALPDTFPSFSDMLVDEMDHIWIREYVPPGNSKASPRWFIFDPQGVLRYSIRTSLLMRRRAPYLHNAPQIGSDFILTSVRDEDGVESVVMYGLRRS